MNDQIDTQLDRFFSSQRLTQDQDVRRREAPESQFGPSSQLSLHEAVPQPSIMSINVITAPSNFFIKESAANATVKVSMKAKCDPHGFSKLTANRKFEVFTQLYDECQTVKVKLNAALEENRISKGRINVMKKPEEEKQLIEIRDQTIQDQRSQIRRLQQKVVALTKPQRPQSSRNNKAPSQSKIVFPVTQNVKEAQQLRKQIKQLLLIIDELKVAKMKAEERLKASQNSRPQKDFTSQKDGSMSGTHHNVRRQLQMSENQFEQYATELQGWKQKCTDLERMIRQVETTKDRRIKELSAELVANNNKVPSMKNVAPNPFTEIQNKQLLQKQQDLADENERLEQELRRLTAMPFYQNNVNVLDYERKITELKQTVQRLKDQVSNLRESNNKLITEVDYAKKDKQAARSELDKCKRYLNEINSKQTSVNQSGQSTQQVGFQIDPNDHYRKLLGLVKIDGNDPAWKKHANMAQPSFAIMAQSELLKTAKDLWQSKLQLLAHLEKAKTELNILKEGKDSKLMTFIKQNEQLKEELRIDRARLDEWKSMDRVGQQRQLRIYEQAGIKYDDEVEVWVQDLAEVQSLQPNENYFDIYFGHLNLDESALLRNPQNRVKKSAQLVSFLTVDFYNHETQHSDLVEGTMKQLGSVYSFKVEMTAYFLKHLNKGSLSLELWSLQGNNSVFLGKGQLWTQQIVYRAVKDISAVISGKCPIYFENDILVGTIEYKMRMRLPIASYVEWLDSQQPQSAAKPQSSLTSQMMRAGRRRKMFISIDYATELPTNSNSFVYFTLQGEDVFTERERGSNPQWDFYREFQVVVDEEFEELLKQKYFEFTVFDDQREVNKDVVGVAKANLTPLVQAETSLDLKLEIKGDDGRVNGRLKLRAGWKL